MTSLVRLVVARRFVIIDDAPCWNCGAALRECAADRPDPWTPYGCCATPDEGRPCQHSADAQRAQDLINEIKSGSVSLVEGAAARTTPEGWPRYQGWVAWSWKGHLDPPALTDISVTADLIHLVIDGHPHPYPCGCWHQNLMDTITSLEREHEARAAQPTTDTTIVARPVGCCPLYPLPAPRPAPWRIGEPGEDQLQAAVRRLQAAVADLERTVQHWVTQAPKPF